MAFQTVRFEICADGAFELGYHKNVVRVNVLTSGLYSGSGRPGPIAFPDPASAIRIGERPILQLQTLIELKLAARRHKAFGDVVELIRVHNLDESFLPQLHLSVHRDFIECLEEKRREDDYEVREG